MKAVLRNCVHGGDIVLVRELDSRGRVSAFVKSSTFPAGIENLRREYEGFRWYVGASGTSAIQIEMLRNDRSYVALRSKYIEGTRVDYRAGLLRYREEIGKVVEHYCHVWRPAYAGAEDLGPLHGDLSLDNVVFRADRPVLLDWEHFSRNASPRGFDAVYLMLESLWFESRSRAFFSQESIRWIVAQLRTMQERSCLSPHLVPNQASGGPTQNVRAFMNQRADLWGSQLARHRNKFPVLLWSDEEARDLDAQMSKIRSTV
jgi:hypothetical protein